MERNEWKEQRCEPWGKSALENYQGRIQETEKWKEKLKELGCRC